MNKAELVRAVAEQLGASRSEANKVVEAVIGCITDGIRSENRVALSGFGTFLKRERPAQMGVHPTTREPVRIRASTTCAFKPATNLREAI